MNTARTSQRGGSFAATRGLVGVILGLLAVATACQTGRADEEVAAKLYANVNGAVAALENLEGSGTGFVIDRSGLILTNAHVIASPLPYKCTLDVRRGNKIETVTFKKVTIVGIHPTKDLALVRIDPKEFNCTLQVVRLAKTRPTPGQRVYAIGNPAGGDQILAKTITSGMISGINRVIDKVAYYQIDAAINPGNSGGPLFNASGEVLGVVTLKFTDVENTGFAIPLYDLDTSKFVPLKKRRGDPERARESLAEATRLYQRAKQIESRRPDSEEAKMYYFYSAREYHEAMTLDPSNDTTYYNVGMLLRTLGKQDVATAYLQQAIEMNPWEEKRQPGSGTYYRELGLAEVQQNKKAEARAAWEEGLAKFPKQAAKLWEDLAVFHAQAGDFYRGAFYAAVALELNSPDVRIGEMNKLSQEMRTHLNPAQRTKLNAEVAKIPDELKRRQAQADRQHQAKKEFLTVAFAKFIKNEGHLGDEGEPPPQVVVAGNEPGSEKTTPPSKTEPAAPNKFVLPAGAIDLINEVNVRHDAVKGTWTADERGLTSPVLSNARLKFPTKLPEEYDLLIVAERQANMGELVVGFVRGDRQSVFYFDADHGSASGLDPASRDAHQGTVFAHGKSVTVVLKVRREGVMATADGRRIFLERSSDPFPPVPDEWSVSDDAHLFLGTDVSRFRIFQMALKPYERK